LTIAAIVGLTSRVAGLETEMKTAAKLMFLCGKMAAGKSTLARDLAERDEAPGWGLQEGRA
jgi:tRNA A37 threonylcarbamoyladenosine biosynthesis protein TsaE